MSSPPTTRELLTHLRRFGPLRSSEVVDRFDISRATLSRRIRELGSAVVVIGRGRSTQLAACHEGVAPTPLYRITKTGGAGHVGDLLAIDAAGSVQWYLRQQDCPSSLCQGEFKQGLYPGWPWFLEDMRPSGFLGRAFGKRMARVLRLGARPELWSDIELLTVLVAFGSDLPGNMIMGDGPAFAEFQSGKMTADGSREPVSPESYPELARRALDEDTDCGSSAGGEQPKFIATVRDRIGEQARSVIVKFSPPTDTAAGRRWADLLHAEHIAGLTLGEAGYAAAATRVHELGGRVFLESLRFDRTGNFGQLGVASLRALDAAHVGTSSESWVRSARNLHASRMISGDDMETMILLHCFGGLINNTDMNWGNLSFFLPEAPPFPLAPVYDMLPMGFRPTPTGEIPNTVFTPPLPTPEIRFQWQEAHPVALRYWHKVANCSAISGDFRQVAKRAIAALERVHAVESFEF